MNKKILVSAGFKKEVQLTEIIRCPFCEEFVILEDFIDTLSIKEFRISGLCQSCQDDFFNNKDEE